MIRSKVKETYCSMPTSLVVVLAATLAVIFAADIPIVSAEDAIFSSDAGAIFPYPDNYDIGIGEDESLLFAGNWENMPRTAWSEEGSLFLVESDVPVILNRITSGIAARVSWGVPGGVSIVVKKICSGSNNTSILEESDDDVVNLIPIVSTAMADVNGQSVAKVSIVADFEEEILPEDEEISLAESRMADVSPNFMPSSEFSLDYKCWSSFGEPCEPKKDNVVKPAAAAEASEDTSDLSSNEKSMDGSETYDASSDSSITDVTDESKTSSTSSASMQKTIATNLLVGLMTTVSILGTAGSIAFVGGRRMIFAVTAVFIFATIFMAILPPPTQSLPSFGSKRSSSATTKSTSTTTTRSLNENVLNQPNQCVINVEIVYWGCNHQVYIDAPDVSLRNSLDDSYDNWDTCQCQAKHLFPWNPVLPADSWGDGPESFDTIGQVEISNGSGESSMVYHVKGGDRLSGDCMLAVGRPYRDNTGSILSASICDANNDSEEDKLGNNSRKTKKQNPWSEPSLSFLANADKEDNSTKDNHQQRLGDNSKDNQKELHKMIWEKQRQRIGKKWANQALGEHASVASFAAFTLALMSNGAPPNLIRDSLTAAQDELRHAKVSFEIATSLLSNSDSSNNNFVEPTALPPSNLQFGANLTELALGTAREGCIEETLSAIEMAVEYDEFVANSIGSDDIVTKQLQPTMETIKTIALEEGNHSVLAWRTIEWVCSSSKEACEAVQGQVLDPTNLNIAGEKRFPEIPQARQIWNCIWTSLLTVTIGVAGNAMKENTNLFQSLCAFDDSADATLSEQLANRIISQLKPDAVKSTM